MQATSGYSADTEILTRHGGWVTFDQLTYMDEVATRSPDGRFEWQAPERITVRQYDGPMVHFHSRTVSLLVTPSHNMLLAKRPRWIPSQQRGTAFLVEATHLADRPWTGALGLVVASTNAQPDLAVFRVPSSATAYNEYVTFDPAELKAARKRLGLTQKEMRIPLGCSHTVTWRLEQGWTVRRKLGERVRDLLGVSFTEHSTKFAFNEMTGSDYAAFMGMWLAEGSVNWHGEVGRRRRPTIYVTQARKSRGFYPYKDLLHRMLGFEPAYTGASFYFRHSGLAEYLRGFGHALEKYLPPEILNLSAGQAETFWHYYWLGDGAAGRARIYTSSPRMADHLQELAQRMGAWATIGMRIPKKAVHMRDGRVIPLENMSPTYAVALHRYPSVTWSSTTVPYTGLVHSVNVPNGTAYVRRDRKPIWSGA